MRKRKPAKPKRLFRKPRAKAPYETHSLTPNERDPGKRRILCRYRNGEYDTKPEDENAFLSRLRVQREANAVHYAAHEQKRLHDGDGLREGMPHRLP